MKTAVLRRIASLLLSLAIPAVCSGCAPDRSGTAAGGRLVVYTSFYPLYDFASKIAGDKAEIHNMIPADIEPHSWEPTPSDLTALENADLFLYNGAGMEHWVDDVLSSLQNRDLIAADTSEGITLLPSDGQSPGEGDAEDEGYDPHIFLGVREAKQQLGNVRDAFLKADPDNRAAYEANYDKYAAEFDRLDQEYTDALAPYAGRSIVVAHQAFGYLCADYGLTQVPVEGLSPDAEPDPATVAKIIEFVKANDVKVIFFEELASPKVAETIAAETGATTDVLHTLEGLTDEEARAGEDYFSLMRENLEALKRALR